jgi:putative lipoprotein
MNVMKPGTTIFALTAFLLASNLNAHDQIFKGTYVRGHEVDAFTPCGSKLSFWASYNWAGQKLVEFYKSKPRDPYQPIYVEFRGHILDEELDGFARSHDGMIRISEVLLVKDEAPAKCSSAS